jgi:hypothetical protein
MSSQVSVPLTENSLPKPHSEPQRFTFLNPDGGEIYQAGSKVAIYWTGGTPLPQSVGISLIDATEQRVAFVISGGIKNESPLGKYTWTIPLIKFLQTSDYQLYIQDDAQTTWTYGPLFKIVNAG